MLAIIIILHISTLATTTTIQCAYQHNAVHILVRLPHAVSKLLIRSNNYYCAFHPLPVGEPPTTNNQATEMASTSSRNEQASDKEEEQEDEWNEDESSHASSEWEEDDEEASLCGRSLLWLCQEGQIQFARRRFDTLFNGKKMDQLKTEVFRVARDKNYVLHELLMGGTSDSNAYKLSIQLLEFCKEYPNDYRQMLLTQPPSHKRTALHWAAWGNAKMEILQPLAFGNPEALVLKDTAGQTPREVLHYYFCSSRNDNLPNPNDPRLLLLERLATSWTKHRLRLTIHQCVARYFVTQQLTPFDKSHRKETNMKPKAWFVLSILGTLLQREMKPLVHRILQYTGGSAKIAAKGKVRKKRASKKGSSNSRKRQRGSQKSDA